MGLDCCASIYKRRIFLPENIIKEFNDSKHAISRNGEFQGKAYNTFIEIIANDSLYCHGSCELTYESLDKFIKDNHEKLLKDDEEKDQIDLRDYFDDYPEEPDYKYMCSLHELYGLCEFFNICSKHKLCLHSSS